jgi:FkbM family methyltransferase
MRTDDLIDYLKLRSLVQDPWNTLRFRKCTNMNDPLEVNFLDGRQVTLRGGYSDYHMFHRIFLRDEYRVHRVKPNAWECVLDLGGNVGLFSVYASRIARRVFSFEPYFPNYELLLANLVGCPNVTAFCEAVASTPGTLRLLQPSDARASGSYSTHTGVAVDGAHFEKVPAVTLNQILDRGQIEHCELLKIDVEGQEYDILYGSSGDVFERIDRIHGEYHSVTTEDPQTRIENFSSFLKEQGYVVDIVPHRRKDNFGMFFASKPYGQQSPLATKRETPRC